MLICPICQESLQKEEHRFVCVNNHSFDVAKEGYVNLSRKQKKGQGDNKQMVQARTRFLEKDYYAFMRAYVAGLLKTIHTETLVDMGCGQGYYTKVFAEQAMLCYGIDASKEAVRYAARHDKKTQYMAGNIFHIPLETSSVDAITALFVPPANQEAWRLLKKDGAYIVVGPGPRHCWQLKEVLYDTPYENPLPKETMKGFRMESRKILTLSHWVTDLWSLLEMTPYRYNTAYEAMEKIKHHDPMDVTFSFVVTVWRKHENND